MSFAPKAPPNGIGAPEPARSAALAMSVSADLFAVYSLGLPSIAAAAIGPFMRRLERGEKTVRYDRESGRRAFGRDRDRVPDRRLPKRVAVADRDFSAVRANGVRIAAPGAAKA